MACSPPTEEKEARSSQPRKTQPPKAVKENRYDLPSPQTRFAKLASFRNFAQAPIGFVSAVSPEPRLASFRNFARARNTHPSCGEPAPWSVGRPEVRNPGLNHPTDLLRQLVC